jgi:tetratricopeptide (TPR) repeat protein
VKRLLGIGTANIVAVLALAGGSVILRAQAPVASLHGHVTNPAGTPLNHGDVKLTTDKSADAKDRKYPFSFPITSTGDYKGTGVLPGDYIAVVFADGKTADYMNVTLRPGEDKALDFDMTRAEYIKNMTPEEKAALEEFKKKNASISADNSKIANINKTLLQARDDEKNGKADVAVTELQPLTEMRPNEPVIWASLGEAQLAMGDAARKAAIAAKTPTTDPAIVKSFADAAVSYQKAIDLSAPPAKPNPDNLSAYYLNLGQALSKSGKLAEAGKAYEESATIAPAKAGTAYYNEAVVYYQGSKLPEAAAAADKAIAIDPKRADAFYIKAQALIPGAKLDPATNKYVLPAGCLEAYQEYLELAPDGPHATEIKEILTGLGQPVKNSFKAGKK